MQVATCNMAVVLELVRGDLPFMSEGDDEAVFRKERQVRTVHSPVWKMSCYKCKGHITNVSLAWAGHGLKYAEKFKAPLGEALMSSATFAVDLKIQVVDSVSVARCDSLAGITPQMRQAMLLRKPRLACNAHFTGTRLRSGSYTSRSHWLPA